MSSAGKQADGWSGFASGPVSSGNDQPERDRCACESHASGHPANFATSGGSVVAVALKSIGCAGVSR